MKPSPVLRAVLIDDEFMGLNSLHILIDKYCPRVKSVAECRNPELAIDIIESYHPDIVFLDINMPQMNGFELLHKLNWRNFHLIFTTAHQEYALKALKANAVDYLLKPIDPEELKAAVKKILKRYESSDEAGNVDQVKSLLASLGNDKPERLLVHSRSGMESIDSGEIICLESQSNYTRLYLENQESILSSKTLKDYEAQLCGERSSFMRVHNSFVINLRKVLRYIRTSETLIMQNNQEIPVSKSRRDEFMKWLQE